MSRFELERALRRPLNHESNSSETQWATDKALGILDWDPDEAEVEEYIRRRADMGDNWAKQVVLSRGTKLR